MFGKQLALATGSSKRSPITFFGILRESPPLHFYLLQFIGFGYLLYRLLSRDYTVYGFLPPEAFNYPRKFQMELWPKVPLLHITTGQFLYHFVPRPNPNQIFSLQLGAIFCCVCGLLGIRPKQAAIVSFLIALHLTGMIQASNAELEGGTLALCAVLVLALSPSHSFYRWRQPERLKQRHVDYHWPVFLYLMIVGCFYSLSGLNKIVDVGPHWPLVLHLEHLASLSIERSLFLFSRYVDPAICAMHASPVLSCIAGVITILAELALLSVLFCPRWRLSLVVVLSTFHVLVYEMGGINFIGSSFLLFLCFDWNMLARTGTVTWNVKSDQASEFATLHHRQDRFALLTFQQSATQTSHVMFEDENGDSFTDLAAIEQIAARCPRMWGLSLALRVPLLSLLVSKRINKRYGFQSEVISDAASETNRLKLAG